MDEFTYKRKQRVASLAFLKFAQALKKSRFAVLIWTPFSENPTCHISVGGRLNRHGPCRPSRVRAASMVSVCQWLFGVASATRSPRGARP